MARRFVGTQLAALGLAADDAVLVTSELVGNVVEHARTAVVVALRVAQTVRIEVQDGNAVIPAVVEAVEDAERGRGLMLVGAYAEAWGIQTTGGGKTIWAEVPIRRQ